MLSVYFQGVVKIKKMQGIHSVLKRINRDKVNIILLPVDRASRRPPATVSGRGITGGSGYAAIWRTREEFCTVWNLKINTQTHTW